MLVLSRKSDESIVIDGRIRVTVLEVRGNQIRLGIEAPRDVPIWRGELKAQKAAAAAKATYVDPCVSELAEPLSC